MPREKFKQKLMKHHICSVARIIACASFLMLTIIGVSSLVRAMSLESIENQNGIPSAWKIASFGNPDTITVPITYWDQRQDSCNDPQRQFEWSQCRLYAKGIIKDVVQSQLGSDGLPVPTYNNSTDAWNAYHDAFTANVIGNNPVQPTDNFYRWFHEAYDQNGKQLSKQFERTITFQRTKDNTYEYGSKGTFPLDDVDFSKDDDATKTGHNFHFTAHMQIPMKIAADGSEHFWFSGDDDVWVFLNGQLVMDLGGLHMDTEGSFVINSDGNVVSTVNNVADKTCRQQKVANPTKIGYDTYNSQVENNCPRAPQTTTIQTHFHTGDIVNLDFFYAERSTSESNTRITISNMQWPISADSDVAGEIKGKVENTESNLVEYITSITNRDPKFPLQLHRIASYIHDESTATDESGQNQTFTNSGFIPLSDTTLYYSTSLDSPDWKSVEISAPMNSLDGFLLKNPLTMSPSGQEGDTLYFRFFAETSEYTGNITNRTSFYTELNGVAGVTYDHATLPYTGKTTTGDGGGEEQPDPQYNLTVTYRIELGDEDPEEVPDAPATVQKTLNNGESYNIPSPEISGYEPDYETVEGVIDGSDVTREVVYRKKQPEEPTKHKITVHYIKNDGTPVRPDTIELIDAGGSFSLTPESLEKHTHTPTRIELTNINSDAEYTVIYTPVREQHSVTVHYVYENGNTAHPDYNASYDEGEKFSISSPVIDGYRRDIAVVAGTMSDKDREFTVTYTMIDQPVGPSPIIPSGPTDPEPETPSQPNEPELPTPDQPEENDNLIPALPVAPGEDDELTYTGPLGEVAFVPNTGIVSDLISPLFDQHFAELILSQTFVLIMLLIFASSFSTYFSLRKYLHLTVAPATTRSVKKMPRSVANSKTARIMQKNAKRNKK